MKTISYGSGADQIGDLYLPEALRAPVVCLLHGGFWRMPFGRAELDPIARDLRDRGFAVWNPEYRRTAPGVPGWPKTLDDVASAIAHLPALPHADARLDLGRVVLIGHSAGGHLAFWAASALGRGRAAFAGRVVAAVGLAPLLDLRAVHDLGLGAGAAEAFLGGTPSAHPTRYRECSPRELLPLGVRQCVIHGDADDVVPIGLSRAYVDAAREAGDVAELVGAQGGGHMDFLDPGSPAHALLCGYLAEVTAAPVDPL